MPRRGEGPFHWPPLASRATKATPVVALRSLVACVEAGSVGGLVDTLLLGQAAEVAEHLLRKALGQSIAETGAN